MKIVKLTQNLNDFDITEYDNITKAIIFDIDDTLYKENKDLVVKRRMAGYNHLKRDLNISFDEFFSLSSKFTKEYGTNYKGFIKNYPIKNDLIEQIDNVYGEISSHFTNSLASVQLLKNLKNINGCENVKVFCFSNSNSKQSEYTLQSLNLDKYIDALFCTGYKSNTEIICKPMKESFDFINKIINKSDKTKILFFDDNEDNVKGSIKAGWIGFKVDDADKIKEIVEKEVQKYF